MPSPTSVWIDCDPGHDDNVAILLAANSSELNVVGLSTCHGNQSVDKTWGNAIRIAAIAGLPPTIPVVKGQGRPLLRTPCDHLDVHGDSGLGGSPIFDAFQLDDERKANAAIWQREKGVLTMFKSISACEDPGGVTLIATAALTNVALLLALYPEIVRASAGGVSRIVIMGGSVGPGNITSCAEFNIFADPEAAKIVFDSGAPVVMVPLEVTNSAITTAARMALVGSLGGGSRFGRMLVELLSAYKQTYEELFGFKDGPPIHDACAVAYAMKSELFTTQPMHIGVVCGEGMCIGRTCCDRLGLNGKKPNVTVALSMDVPGFWQILFSALQSCDRKTILNRIDV